jgi:hypothetical protein
MSLFFTDSEIAEIRILDGITLRGVYIWVEKPGRSSPVAGFEFESVSHS